MSLIWLVFGCAWVTQAEQDDLRDHDGDGFLNSQLGGSDCDDGDAAVGDGTPYWRDADGDGYGGAATSENACEHPGDGWSDNAEDCDDADAAIGDRAASWRDRDGDGFGDASTPATDCEDPGEGWSENADDCDDADEGAHPGATQVCDDVDNDCDGLPGDCNLEDAGRLLLGGDEGAHAGAAAAALPADSDAYDDVAVGAPDGAEGGHVAIMSGAPWTDDGGDTDWVPLSEARSTWTGQPGDRGGEALLAADLDGDGDLDLAVGAPAAEVGDRGDDIGVVWLFDAPFAAGELETEWFAYGETVSGYFGATLASGDVDGDDVADLLVGAPDVDDGSGLAYLIRGPLVGEVDAWTTTQGQGAKFVPVPGSTDRLGDALAFGDIDADGLDDLVFGTPGSDEPRPNVGGAWICTTGPDDVTYLEECEVHLEGAVAGDEAGAAVAAVDVDDDGYADLFVGAPGMDDAQVDVGGVFLVRGGAGAWSPSMALDDAGTVFVGEADGAETGGRAGSALTLPGDLNDDGLPDLVIGAPRFDHPAEGPNVGGVWILFGPLGTGRLDLADADDRQICQYSGEEEDACGAGGSLAPGGDVDADGTADVLVGGTGFTDGTLIGGGTLVLFGAGYR